MRFAATSPAFLLLDEPSQGLAPILVQRVGERLGTIAQAGVGVVMAEQNLAFALSIASRLTLVSDPGRDRALTMARRALVFVARNPEEAVGVAFFLVMVGRISIGVLCRYARRHPLIWTEEVSTFAITALGVVSAVS